MQVVLGLDFGGTKIALAISDLAGERLLETVVPTSAADGAAANLRQALDASAVLIDKLDGADLLAVGASTFGIPTSTGVHLAPAIPGWQDLHLQDELRSAFPGAAVGVITDVKAAATAEAAGGALVGCDPGVYLNLGTGLAAAIVIGGEVMAGRDGAAGEIGYNLRAAADLGLDPARRPVLEDTVSGIGLARMASGVGSRSSTAAELFAAAASDQVAAAAVADFRTELAFHLVNLAIAVNPARIVVGGGITGSWDQLHDGLRQALDSCVPYPPELMLARFPFDAPLRGALHLGLALAHDRTGPTAPPRAGRS